MKLLNLKSYFYGLVLALAATGSAFAIEAGKPAPEFSLPDINGQTHNLSQYKGKLVVLEWTNPECPYVERHYETKNMQEIQKEYMGKGIVWLSVATNPSFTTQELAKINTQNAATPTAVLIDKGAKVASLYEAKTTPHMFIIDPQGKLIYNGAIDDRPKPFKDTPQTAKNYVRVALNEVGSGKAVSNPMTKPYGCSVKY